MRLGRGKGDVPPLPGTCAPLCGYPAKGSNPMKPFVYGTAVALALMTLPALAQETAKDKPTIHPTELMAEKAQRPPLQLDDRQKAEIRAAVDLQDTAQKAPKDFRPTVGGEVPKAITMHAMPLPLLERLPSLKQYDYAKLEHEVLVIDPMAKKIVAILPGAGGGTATSGSNAPNMEPAGDSGDKPNGTAGSTNKE